MNALAKAVGLRWFERERRGWSARFSWAEISGGFGLALGLCLFEEGYSLHVHLLWPNVFLKLPRYWRREPHGGMESWGFTVMTDDCSSIHFNWGARVKIVHMPWDWAHIRHQVWVNSSFDPWVKPAANEYEAPYGDGRHVETHPYTYILRDGTVQLRTATIYGERREWRWRWFKYLPWPRLVRRCISVSFSDEVGERTGSWKGGTVGCGYDWREGETMEQALRRMERERKF